jgi:hypothetical protein
MNNSPWSKILLFSVLSLVLGIVLGLVFRGHGHGGGFCREAGICRMAGCEDGKMGCCKGEGHEGMSASEHGGMAACCMGKGAGHHGEEDAEVIIERIKASDFQGDTTIAIEDGTVNIHKEGDQMEVKVEVKEDAEDPHKHHVTVTGTEEKEELQ